MSPRGRGPEPDASGGLQRGRRRLGVAGTWTSTGWSRAGDAGALLAATSANPDLVLWGPRRDGLEGLLGSPRAGSIWRSCCLPRVPTCAPHLSKMSGQEEHSVAFHALP